MNAALFSERLQKLKGRSSLVYMVTRLAAIALSFRAEGLFKISAMLVREIYQRENLFIRMSPEGVWWSDARALKIDGKCNNFMTLALSRESALVKIEFMLLATMIAAMRPEAGGDLDRDLCKASSSS